MVIIPLIKLNIIGQTLRPISWDCIFFKTTKPLYGSKIIIFKNLPPHPKTLGSMPRPG